MCGIAGIFDTRGAPSEIEELKVFTRSLSHRGPDGEGFYINGEIALGHRRLAITGRSHGARQPLSYAKGLYWITFNGEIYNFEDLRKELESLGHRFETDTDTEVVLASFVQWGPDCQLKFNGMWAFAIWSSRERELFLCRDRFGIKPLFYFERGNYFAFASELKAFLRLEAYDLTFDSQYISDDLAGQAAADATENTFLSGIKRLPAGHFLLRSRHATKVSRWWNLLDHLKDIEPGFEKQSEMFLDLFTDACRIASPAETPFGTTLSGGLDSSSILFTLSGLFDERQSRSPYKRIAVHTYFPESDIDERNHAARGADDARISLKFNRVDQVEAFSRMDQSFFDYEDLKGCPSARWFTYRELRRQNLSVVLEGEGADELLAGYVHHPSYGAQSSIWPYPRLKKIREYLDIENGLLGIDDNMSLFHFSKRVAHKHCFFFLGELFKGFDLRASGTPRLRRFWRALHRRIRPKRVQLDWLKIEPRPFYFDAFEKDRSRLKGFGSLEKQLYWDFHYGLLPNILRSVDRCSMAHGVEVRSPFLDWRLVCYIFSLPTESKLGGGSSKRILRAAMENRIPPAIRDRSKKIPFQTPLPFWLKKPDGPAREFLLSHLQSRDFLQSNIWDGKKILASVEASLKKDDYNAALSSWTFMQASRVKRLFSEHREAF